MKMRRIARKLKETKKKEGRSAVIMKLNIRIDYETGDMQAYKSKENHGVAARWCSTMSDLKIFILSEQPDQ